MRRLDDRLARRVAWLMLARVVLLLVVLVAVVVLETSSGVSGPGSERQVLFAVLAGLGATVGSGFAVRWFHNPQFFGTLQVATDLTVTTAIVYATGAGNSVFPFLYVLVVAYAALLFDRRLSVITAMLASCAYAGTLLATARGWGGIEAVASPLPLLAADAAIKAGALLVVAALASGLSRELARADRALDERTRDFGQLQNLHELTVHSLGSGLLTVDHENVIRSYNREAEHITGVPGRDALEKPLESILPGAGAFLRRGGEGERKRERMPFRDAAGEPLHLGLAASVLRDSEGRPGGHVVIFQDITEIVEMEAELRQSERMAAVGELAAGIAHEVRNPLASISGSVEMLRSSLPENDTEQRRLMDIVLRETDRLDHLIGDFLLYARPNPPKPEPVPLAVMTEELREMYGSACPAGVNVRISVPDDLRPWVDPDQLRQTLWNLLLNGGQAMTEGGGELCLEASRIAAEGAARGAAEADSRVAAEGDSRASAQEGAADGRIDRVGEGCAQIEIVVSDTGVGIDPDLLERVFEPFFTTKPRGSGLGLALVHRIVEANAGALSIESEQSRGTQFRLRFPEAERTADHVGVGGMG